MFVTLAEAEKAREMIRRTTSQDCALGGRSGEAWHILTALPTGAYQTLRDWEEVADFVLHFAPQEQEERRQDDRAQKVKDAREWVQAARDIRFDLPNERTQALVNAVSRIVEVLA